MAQNHHDYAPTQTAASFAARSKRSTPMPPAPSRRPSKRAKKLRAVSVLARAEAQIGNTVGAENYYQYAEHFFRSMSSDREGT